MKKENSMAQRFSAEREKIRNLTPKEKLQYFSDYYKWPLIITIVIIAAVASIIYAYFKNNYNTYLNITIVNGSFKDSDQWEKTLTNEFGIDGKKNRITFNKSNFTNSENYEVNLSTYDKLINCFYAKEIDVYIGTEVDVEYFSRTNYFYDLRDILSEEQWNALSASGSDIFFYAKSKKYDENENEYIEDIPVGIKASHLAKWSETTAVMDEPILCFSKNSTNISQIQKFIDYILE